MHQVCTEDAVQETRARAVTYTGRERTKEMYLRIFNSVEDITARYAILGSSLGEFPATGAAMRTLVAKLAAKYRRLTFCYEAGPTGYGLYRLIKSLGHERQAVAPSLTPKKPGDRVKTNRRDGLNLAKLLRAGELTNEAIE